MNSNDSLAEVKPQQVSGLAIASLVLSCLSVFLGPFGCVPGIICGHLARIQIQTHRDVTGAGIATAGLIIGYIFLVLIALMVILVASITVQRIEVR